MRIVKTRRVEGLAELHLAQFGDDPSRMAEFVDTLEPGVPKSRKWVLMISTQLGCAVGCSLCDAGALGYYGNLSAEDMLDQVRHVLRENPDLDAASHPKLKIHFARMGEPTLNPAVLEALRRLPETAPGPGLLPSLATVAPQTPAADRFLDELRAIKDERYGGGRFQLQFSLHATDDESRRKVVPIRSWSLDRIAEWGRTFRKPDDRKITLNFALPPGVETDADAIAARFTPGDFLIKITPVNPTRTADETGRTNVWREPTRPVSEFARSLERRGYEVILSPSLPEEIEAATSCGQLWSGALREQASVRSRNRRRDENCYVRASNLVVKAAEWKAELRPYVRNAPGELRRPALLVVDVQEFFMSPRSPAFLPASRAIAANLMLLTQGFRDSGRPVAFTVHAYDDAAAEAGPMARWWRNSCASDSPEARLAGILSRRAAEPLFRKTRYSAFSNPALLPWLRASEADGLIVCGLMTNLCVESTAREAFSLGFDVRIPVDGTASVDEALHVGALRNAAFGFASIQYTEELLDQLCPKSF